MDWRDGSVVKITGCSSRGLGFKTQNFTAIYNSCPRESNTPRQTDRLARKTPMHKKNTRELSGIKFKVEDIVPFSKSSR